jgi:copper chaperone
MTATASYRIEGMTCDGCARAVAKAIAAVAPGAGIEVDRAASRVAVAGGPDAEAIRRAVERAGFVFAGPA